MPSRFTSPLLTHSAGDHDISSIDLLKMDVEGYELEVLRGAESLLKSGGIRHIQFEFGTAAIESWIFLKDFIQLLSNYTLYRIRRGGPAAINYSEYSESFLTTNYLAVLNDR